MDANKAIKPPTVTLTVENALAFRKVFRDASVAANGQDTLIAVCNLLGQMGLSKAAEQIYAMGTNATAMRTICDALDAVKPERICIDIDEKDTEP